MILYEVNEYEELTIYEKEIEICVKILYNDFLKKNYLTAELFKFKENFKKKDFIIKEIK